MLEYRHNFDLGTFVFYKDNKDGTALFYEKIYEDTSPLRIECRLVRYRWGEVVLIEE